tara:strand:+ start:1596 stop:2105 length:510 start_codon:yes stop_codon:yes gene_type:complete
MKKILYLHGLESDQGGSKVDYLSSKYIVHAPKLDYKDPKCFWNIFWLIEEGDFDLIIGSSMGGYLALTMGEVFELPTILFNPALHSRSFEPVNPYKPKLGRTVHNVILGEEDNVIDYNKTCEYLNLNDIQYIKELIPNMTHRTPTGIFIDVVDKRINQLNTLSNITNKF